MPASPMPFVPSGPPSPWKGEGLGRGSGIPPPLCGPPPFHKGGCCYARLGSLVKGSWHGAAVTEGFRTPVVPLIRHGLRSRWQLCCLTNAAYPLRVLRPCHLLPCGAKALAVLTSLRQTLWRSPHPSRLAPCHLPPGEGFLFLTPGAGVGADMIRPESPRWASSQ